jgi:hypothetical protein
MPLLPRKDHVRIKPSLFFVTEVTAKRLALLHELVPKALRVAVLVNPANVPAAETTLRDVQNAAHIIGLQIQVLRRARPEPPQRSEPAARRRRRVKPPSCVGLASRRCKRNLARNCESEPSSCSLAALPGVGTGHVNRSRRSASAPPRLREADADHL